MAEQQRGPARTACGLAARHAGAARSGSGRPESEEIDDEQRGTRRLHTPHDGLVLISDLATARRSSVGVCGRADKGRSAAFPAKGAAHRVVRDKGDHRTTLPLQLACEQEQRLHVTARAEGDEEDSGAGVLWGQLPGEAAIDTLDGHRVASRCRGKFEKHT